MKLDKKEAKEKFDDFLMIMDEQLDWLVDQAEVHGITLDRSLDDLSNLEKLFNLMSEGRDKDYISRLVVTFARYLGELVRLNCGGKWTLSIDDERNVNFNSPVIIGHTPIEGLEFAPIMVMGAYALRRKNGTLRRAIDADLNPKPLDLGDLVEE